MYLASSPGLLCLQILSLLLTERPCDCTPGRNEIQDLFTANPRMLPNRVVNIELTMTTVNMMSFITEHYHLITDNTGKRGGHWLHVA